MISPERLLITASLDRRDVSTNAPNEMAHYKGEWAELSRVTTATRGLSGKWARTKVKQEKLISSSLVSLFFRVSEFASGRRITQRKA